MKTRTVIISYVVMAAIIAFLLLQRSCNSQKITNLQALNTALTDKFTVIVNEKGQETAKRQIIIADYHSLKKLHVADSTDIGKLQKLVDRHTLSATVVSNTTSTDVKGKTIVEFEHNKPELPDSSKQAITGTQLPCDTVYPIYKDTISDKWQQIIVRATKDSTEVKTTVHNEYDITQKFVQEGKWPFRKRVPEISILNLNPNTKTQELVSYHAQVPKKRYIFVIAGSLLAGFIGGLIIK